MNVYTRGIAGTAALLVLAALTLTACGSGEPAPGSSAPASAVPTGAPEARVQLAGLAAAAQDRKITALYTWSAAGRTDRTVVLTTAVDGSWRVDVPRGALGGTADVSMAQTGEGLFQCALPSAERPVQPACVRVADPDGAIDRGIDPRVQHPLTDWREVFTDRTAPLSVSVAQPLPGVTGLCFSVETTTASVDAPLEAGIYCYAPDGTFTGAKVSFGTLALAGAPSGAPPTISLPGPVLPQEPLGMAAPPSPTATPSPTPSA